MSLSHALPVCLALLAAPALADAPLPVEDGALAPAALVLYVFDEDGLPTRAFRLEGSSEAPGEAAALRAQLPASRGELTLVLLDGEQARRVSLGAVPLVSGEETEVLVNLGAKGAFHVHVDGPKGALLPPPASLEGHEEPLSERCASARITGLIVSLEDSAPVKDVAVLVRGRELEARSDEAGRFSLELPAGSWGLSFIHPDHSAEVQEGVALGCGEAKELVVELSPRAGTLDTLVVKVPKVAGTVAAALDERKKASTITEVLGAEQMSKSGDSDAASALRRVTGLTVVDGKYVYVRGLGERYSSTLMNGASLPSPEPERRVVPLDLFPSGVLDGMVIKKTYSPDLPGEFGGGTVELKTRGVPEDFILKLGVGTGALLGTTLSEGLTYRGGPLDLLGLDAGARSLPEPVREASRDQAVLPSDRFGTRGYSPEELERLGELMPNVWSPERALVPPGFSLSGELGDRFELGPVTLGYLAAAHYGNGYRASRHRQHYLLVGQGGALERAHSYDFESMKMEVDGGAILTLGALFGEEHQVTSTAFLGRITDDETRVYQGTNRDVGTEIRVSRLRFVERTLLAEQLYGEHTFPALFGLGLDWGYTYALALRHEPDTRETRYDHEGGTARWNLSDRPEGNQRFFSDLTDHSHDAKLSLTLSFSQWNGLEANVKVGAAVATKSRSVDTRRYKFKNGTNVDPKLLSRPPEEIFLPEHIGAGAFEFQEFTQPTDNYSAGQVIAAGYAMTDLPLWHGLKLQGGVRVEYGRQQVTTFELFNPDNEPVVAEIDTLDVLPAANLSWEVIEDMHLRSAFSVTVSRPDFRELSPATFNDVTGGRQIFGNPDLERALIYAGDLRWEWYPTLGTSLSAALFYKHFQDPIEQVVIASAQQSVTFENAEAADNVGVEVEGRFDFGLLHEYAEGLYVAGNAALIYSRVALGESGITTSKERPLQGQSPYVVNLQLGYDHEELGTNATLLYNVFGPRIAEVGAQGAPDVYEQPFHSLDVVLKQRLPGGFSVGLTVKNLLDLPVEVTQGDEQLVERLYKGRAVSLSLGWSY